MTKFWQDCHRNNDRVYLFSLCPDLNIQGETHDSIEDARTALQLYRKYLELSRGGGTDEVRKVLKGLYEKGRQLDWKVPDSDAAEGQGSPRPDARLMQMRQTSTVASGLLVKQVVARLV